MIQGKDIRSEKSSTWWNSRSQSSGSATLINFNVTSVSSWDCIAKTRWTGSLHHQKFIAIGYLRDSDTFMNNRNSSPEKLIKITLSHTSSIVIQTSSNACYTSQLSIQILLLLSTLRSLKVRSPFVSSIIFSHWFLFFSFSLTMNVVILLILFSRYDSKSEICVEIKAWALNAT